MGNILVSHNEMPEHIEHCGICLNEMKNKHKYQKFTCSHNFHKECIDAWNNNCPICRNSTLRIPKKVDISGIRGIPNIVPPEYHDIYLRTWKNQECKMKKRILLSPLNSLAISHCFISSREKITKRLGLYFLRVSETKL